MFVRRYLDKERIKKATGDLPDFEHAILGSMTCNYVILEKNMAAIITHSRKELGENIRAKVFKETKKFIESLS